MRGNLFGAHDKLCVVWCWCVLRFACDHCGGRVLGFEGLENCRERSKDKKPSTDLIEAGLIPSTDLIEAGLIHR